MSTDKIDQNYRGKSYATNVHLIAKAISIRCTWQCFFSERCVHLFYDVKSSRIVHHMYKAKNVQKIQRINKEANRKRSVHGISIIHILQASPLHNFKRDGTKVKNYDGEEARRNHSWLADGRSDNGRFHSRIRENGLYDETKGTRLKGTQLRLNSVDPAVFTHTGGAGGPVRVLSVSSSSRSLTPLLLRPLDGFNLLSLPSFLSSSSGAI